MYSHLDQATLAATPTEAYSNAAPSAHSATAAISRASVRLPATARRRQAIPATQAAASAVTALLTA